jgi:predicted PurR-regulated permease PerM
LEHRFFKEKLELMSSNPIKRARINSIVSKIKNDVRAYFFIKTLTSITT